MDDEETLLTRSQWEAARMLIARLHCEANSEPFTHEAIGMKWLSAQDPVCAETASGVEVRAGDIIYACIVLLWSALVQEAAMLDDEPADAVARLALGLALVEPNP